MWDKHIRDKSGILKCDQYRLLKLVQMNTLWETIQEGVWQKSMSMGARRGPCSNVYLYFVFCIWGRHRRDGGVGRRGVLRGGAGGFIIVCREVEIFRI